MRQIIPYLVGFLLVFLGFVAGFFTAAICAAAGRGEEQDRIFEEEIRHRMGHDWPVSKE
jgi:hypothetical protein